MAQLEDDELGSLSKFQSPCRLHELPKDLPGDHALVQNSSYWAHQHPKLSKEAVSREKAPVQEAADS